MDHPVAVRRTAKSITGSFHSRCELRALHKTSNCISEWHSRCMCEAAEYWNAFCLPPVCVRQLVLNRTKVINCIRQSDEWTMATTHASAQPKMMKLKQLTEIRHKPSGTGTTRSTEFYSPLCKSERETKRRDRWLHPPSATPGVNSAYFHYSRQLDVEHESRVFFSPLFRPFVYVSSREGQPEW